MSNLSALVDLPRPPVRFFYNRFWQRKLIRWGWSYVDAGIIAQDIAEKCYLRPYDIHIVILRDATQTYRFPDPGKAVVALSDIRDRKKCE